MSKYVSLFILSFLFIPVLLGQSRSELEKRRNELTNDIALTTKLIEETKHKKDASLSELLALNKQISSRQELITNINQEIRILDRQIDALNAKIFALQEELQELKREYAKMIEFASKNRSSYDKLSFVFSSDNFNQAYKRLKYLQQYSTYRKQQADFIVSTQKELDNQIARLESNKREKNNLLLTVQGEKVKLSTNKDKQSQLVKGLQDTESKLRRELKKKQADAKKLETAIQNAIKKELEEERKRAEAERNAGRSGINTADIALSNSFNENKGRLPWPVAQGIISEKFGVQPHPVLKGITISNDGINIRTQSNAGVKAIFKGTVSGVIEVPGYQKMVIISHGDYRTVYANMKEVFVKKGDEVLLDQKIGVVYTDPQDSKSEVHFQIWSVKDGMQKQNPEDWIGKR